MSRKEFYLCVEKRTSSDRVVAGFVNTPKMVQNREQFKTAPCFVVFAMIQRMVRAWGLATLWCQRRRAAAEQMSTGHLHIMVRVPLLHQKTEIPEWASQFLVRAWGLEPQRKAQEPKSCMSTNSIMPACLFILASLEEVVNVLGRWRRNKRQSVQKISHLPLTFLTWECKMDSV